jgi:MarR family transcriptional regulator, 2-MHQ and catechol-resistance regulon repressor
VLEDRREAFYHECVRRAGPRYAGFDRSSVEIVLSFLYTYDQLHQTVSRYMADYGLSKSSVNILMLLRHGSDEGMQLHDLGELLLVSRANITGLMDHLEEKGYVKRVVDPQDRRARHARITPKGETLLDEFMPVHYRNLKAMLQELSSEEKDTLVGLLRKVRLSMSVQSERRAGQEFVTCQTAE